MLHGVSPDMKQIQLRYIEGIINCCGVEKKISTKCTHKKRTKMVSIFSCVGELLKKKKDKIENTNICAEYIGSQPKSVFIPKLCWVIVKSLGDSRPVCCCCL